MAIIEDRYTKISIWCRPLRCTVYRFDSMKKKRIIAPDSATTSLILRMRESERREVEASGILERKSAPKHFDIAEEAYTNALSTTSESYQAFEKQQDEGSRPLTIAEAIEAIDAEAPVKKHRLSRLRAKVSDALFDYSEIEQEKIEQEVEELVNKDGYYNELEPVDIDVEYQPPSIITKPVIFATLAFIAYIIFIIYF